MPRWEGETIFWRRTRTVAASLRGLRVVPVKSSLGGPGVAMSFPLIRVLHGRRRVAVVRVRVALLGGTDEDGSRGFESRSDAYFSRDRNVLDASCLAQRDSNP